MQTTSLQLEEKLPLTCSRKGTCCHGNRVLLNPWELFCLAREKKITPREFRDLYTEFGGIQLSFNGKSDFRGKPACSQYIENFGCSVHLGRPLACRLFPIGRQIQSNKVQYIYQGNQFPCFDGCLEVVELPQLTVGEYLQGQETKFYEKAQDEYLELMQNLADMAFELLLETELAATGLTKTLPIWKEMGNESPEALVKQIGSEWLDCLMIPAISEDIIDSKLFVQQHSELLQAKAQETFGMLKTEGELQDVCNKLMAIALHLALGIGANTKVLADHWCESAKKFLEDKK